MVVLFYKKRKNIKMNKKPKIDVSYILETSMKSPPPNEVWSRHLLGTLSGICLFDAFMPMSDHSSLKKCRKAIDTFLRIAKEQGDPDIYRFRIVKREVKKTIIETTKSIRPCSKQKA